MAHSKSEAENRLLKELEEAHAKNTNLMTEKDALIAENAALKAELMGAKQKNNSIKSASKVQRLISRIETYFRYFFLDKIIRFVLKNRSELILKK
jgi:hypothetical protein